MKTSNEARKLGLIKTIWSQFFISNFKTTIGHVVSLLKKLLAWLIKLSKQKTGKFSTFADDFNGVGSFENLKRWWGLLE